MDSLLHNPIADMYGPQFLLLYALVIIFTLVAARILVRQRDWTRWMPLPGVPAEPDPYEIAYLRGGEAEVAHALVFALSQRGYLQTTERDGDTFIERVAHPGEPRRLPQLERRVLEWFQQPRSAREVFTSYGLPFEIKGGCMEYEQKMRREHLLLSQGVEQMSGWVMWAGAFVIVGLGGYKLIVALAKGRSNVWLLVVTAIVGLIILDNVRRVQTTRLSRRGKEYLDRLQTAYIRLKDKHSRRKSNGNSSGDGNASNAGDESAARAAAFDPTLLLLVSVYGVGALAGTPYENYQRTMYGPERHAVAGSSWGDAGASGSDGGGSDSGGGDSSSSCGGGSGCGGSCGGGCGGCGG